MGNVLGIDVSTTATKAVVIDESGAVVGIGTAEYGFESPQPLWSEQDPRLWWDGSIAAIRSVLASTGVAGADIAAVGLTGQMHGAVLLDAAGEVLRPAILWNDQRTAAECDAIREAVGAERLIEITGNDALTGFTAPKLVWVRDHEPAVWDRIAHVLLPKDFVRHRLTGEYALDKADGAGTILFDLAARDWSAEVVGGTGDRPCVAAADVRGSRRDGRVTARRPRRRGSGKARRSWQAPAIRPRTPSGSGRSRRASLRSRWGLRGDLRDDRVTAARSARPGPRLLSRGARSVAPDDGDAVGGRQPPLVPRCPGARHGLRGAGRAGLGGARGERRVAVPAVPDRRAESAPGSLGPWRVRRADFGPRPPPSHPGRAGGRGVRAARRPRADARHGNAGAITGPRLGRRHRQSALAPDPRRRAAHRDRHRRHHRGAAYGAGLLAAVGAGWFESVEAAAKALVNATPVAGPGPDADRYAEAFERYRALYPALADTFHRM